jgi:4'-phosphopantetheinyl transferase
MIISVRHININLAPGKIREDPGCFILNTGMEITDIAPTLPIKPGEVHVWLFDLAEACEENLTWGRLLSGEETDRSDRYRFETDRQRFIARRGILRQLLGRYCGLNPSRIHYHVNPYGKLSLMSNLLFFNLSNSQNRIAFVFTLEKDIGVDIEQVRPMTDHSLMAERFFSQEEQTGLSALPAPIQTEAFYHIWTQKEAFIKAHGKGLSWPLKDFSVSVEPNKPGRLLSIKGGSDGTSSWQMFCTKPEADWRVAVCIRAETEINVLGYKPKLSDFLL